MSDDLARRVAGRAARGAREGALVFVRLKELHERPVDGHFDVEHLKAVHAYLFQDLPEHRPGVIRTDTGGWSKTRVLEGEHEYYDVHYAHENIEARLAGILSGFGGPATLRGLSADEAAAKLAALYGDLDHVHGFYEGNSRTLREFLRELAGAGGFSLQWAQTNAGAPERNALYIARDVAALERAFPGLTPERGMETNDRAEYGVSLALPRLRRRMGSHSLEEIIREGLSREP